MGRKSGGGRSHARIFTCAPCAEQHDDDGNPVHSIHGQNSSRENVRRLLEDLPEDVSYEDIQYHIYVQQKIDAGLAAAERGEFIADEEVEQRIARGISTRS
ncbi:MAG TPA: hypothetical protein VF381_11215 [Thermoanaerobaculia bacterium]